MIIKRALPVARAVAALNKTKWSACATAGLLRRPYSSHDAPPPGYRFPTMDELPLPCGDWCEDYQNKQRKYNLHLIFGVGFFTITSIVAYYSGLLWCNHRLPDYPAPREQPC